MHTSSHVPGEDNKAKKYNLWSAYVKMFKSYSDFMSRSRRSEYWYAYLMNFIISFIMILILIPAMLPELGFSIDDGSYKIVSAVTEFIYMVYTLVVFLPQTALTVRRLHDIGMSGIWVVLTFFPLGSLVILFFMAKDSAPGMNKYGLNPKE